MTSGFAAMLGRWLGPTRTGVVFRNIIAAFWGRIVNVLCTLVSVPLAIGALGQEQYGIFAVILSVTTFFGYADFGLGVAVVTELTQAEACGDFEAAQRAVSQVWFFLIGCAVTVAILGGASVSGGLVDRFFPAASGGSLSDAWIILIGASALGIPLGIGQRIFFALQLGATAQAWATAGRISALVGALFAACFWPSVAAFVVGTVLVPNLVAGASVMHLFFRLRPDLRPSLSTLSTEKLGGRVLMGLNFTILHLLNFAESGADTILIAQFYNSRTVAQFDLLTRLFGYVLAIIGMGMWPLWPAISSAVAQGDLKWIWKVRSIGWKLVSAMSLGLATFFAVWSEPLVRLWTGVELTLPESNTLVLSLVCFVTVSNAMSFQQIFLTAFNDISRQTVVAIIIICIIFPLKWILLKNGILYGIIIASSISYLARYIYYEFIVHRHLSNFNFGSSRVPG